MNPLWNELAAHQAFTLLCGYRNNDAAAPALGGICAQHARHVGPTFERTSRLGSFAPTSNV